MAKEAKATIIILLNTYFSIVSYILGKKFRENMLDHRRASASTLGAVVEKTLTLRSKNSICNL